MDADRRPRFDDRQPWMSRKTDLEACGAAIRECILRVSTLVDDHPEISELDINPLIVYPEGRGAVVADCRIMLRATSA